jgi:(1->4)-alpha-D-glucan 1-alpha-D-glucosylmutase
VSALEQLADLVGVAAGYTDAFGKPVETPLEVRGGLLAALGFAVDDAAAVAESLERVESLRRGLIPPLLPVEARRAARVPVRLRDGAPHTLVWRLVDERGTAREGRANPHGSEPGFELPPLTPGYHRLTVQAGQTRTESWVIAAPQRCWRPRPYTEEGASDWGMAAQLYGLRSGTNIGIGTYADAGEAAREAALRGAAFLGLSPVHALFGSDRTKISPYSPSSRLFLETLFIAPRNLPGLAGSRAEALLDERADTITALREAALVDHQGVHDVLDPVLRALWADSPARAGTDAEFERFRQEGGEDLESHALFEALSEHFRGQGAHWLGDWPEEYRRAGTEAVKAFAAGNAELVGYHAWLQYLADRQLAEASAAALGSGMRVGLYRDLAVGADRGGSEIWSHPERFADKVSIGAPPDLLAPKGQNWGLPAFDPLAMERDGLAAFRALVQANMRHAGAERRRGGFGELPVGEVLQPRVVADQLGILHRKGPHRLRAGPAIILRPVAQPVGALLPEMLGQRLEHGVRLEILAALLTEALETRIGPGPGRRLRPERPEHRVEHVMHALVIDEGGLAQGPDRVFPLGEQRLGPGSGKPRQAAWRDEQGLQEQARGGRVGRDLGPV